MLFPPHRYPTELGAFHLPQDGLKVRLFRSLVRVWIPGFFISIPFLFLFGRWLYIWPVTHHQRGPSSAVEGRSYSRNAPRQLGPDVIDRDARVGFGGR